MLFLILFHCYAFNAFENFSATAINILGFNLQVFSLLLTILIWLLLSENSSSSSFGIFLFPLFFFLFFLFFFYNTNVIVSTWHSSVFVLSSDVLILNWEFFFFFFFFIGWVFKLANKYSLESFTNNESFLYNSIAPSLYFFEFYTFIYCIIWSYVNFTLVGYPTVMYLNVFNVTTVTGCLLTKMFFYSSVYVGFLTLILMLNNGQLNFFFTFYFLLIIYISFFLINEFNEFWAYTHAVAPANTLNFTFFKYFMFILFFNFFHAYVVVVINFIIILIYLNSNTKYSISFEFLFLTVNNFYLIMWLTCLLLFSSYLITELGVYSFFQ